MHVRTATLSTKEGYTVNSKSEAHAFIHRFSFTIQVTAESQNLWTTFLGDEGVRLREQNKKRHNFCFALCMLNFVFL